MNPLFSNRPIHAGPMTQTNAAEPFIGPTLRERLREPIELSERIELSMPIRIVPPWVYEAMKEDEANKKRLKSYKINI